MISEDEFALRLAEQQAFLTRLARGLVHDPATADDLVQSTLTSALQHWTPRAAGFEKRTLRAWLATTLRRRAVSDVRSHRRRVVRERSVARSESDEDSAERDARRLDARAALAAALARLPKEQARALLLRYSDELTPDEIAARVSAPVATVKARLKRGLAQLRRDLDAAYGGARAPWVAALLDGPAVDTAAMPRSKASSSADSGGLEATTPAVGLTVLVGMGVGVIALAVIALGLEGPPARSVGATVVRGASVSVEGVVQTDGLSPAPRSTASVEVPAGNEAVAPQPRGRPNPSPSGATADDDEEERVFMLAMNYDEASLGAAFLRIRLTGLEHDVLAGHVRLEVDGLPKRVVELRGRTSEREFDIRVPPGVPVTLSADLDGCACTPIRVHTPAISEWREVELPLVPEAQSARLSLRLLSEEHLEGRRFLVTLQRPDGLVMPMRGPTCAQGRLDCGRIPSGDFVLTGVDEGAAGWGKSEQLVFMLSGELSAREDALFDVEVTEGGSFRVDALSPVGARLSATVEVERPGAGRTKVSARSKDGTRSYAGTALDTKHPSVLMPLLAPGPVTLYFACEGYHTASIDAVVRPGEIEPLRVTLTPE